MKKIMFITALIFSAATIFANHPGRYAPADRFQNDFRPMSPRGNAYGHYPRHNRPVAPTYHRPVFAPVVQPCAPIAMNNFDFAALRQTIYRAPFESTKLSIFRQALAYNYFTTAQVMDLMGLFYFDSSRLELAKMAYPFTVDPQRYYLLNSAFTFSSSARELGDYLAMR